MIKKVGIVGINKYSSHMNYGAALHTYAFQQYLQRKGIESIIIDYIPSKFENYHFRLPILEIFQKSSYRRKALLAVRWGLGAFSNLRKYYKFQRFFLLQYCMTSEIYTTESIMLENALDKYSIDAFVCESDIIWKRKSLGGCFDAVFFLNFPSTEGRKKVAYAPTLGSERFQGKDLDEFKDLLSGLDYISTRESEDAKYLSKLLGREIPWVLDPTLLLDVEDYNKILVSRRHSRKKYLLVYNCMINDHAMIKEARILAKRLGLKLIEISNFSENKIFFNHTIKTGIGIEEFLGFFSEASFVICNAFHGLCFSLIFKKEFFIFQRDLSDTRMLNIIEAVGLNERFVSCEKKRIPENWSLIDYKEVSKSLEKLRNNSEQFILESIIGT